MVILQEREAGWMLMQEHRFSEYNQDSINQEEEVDVYWEATISVYYKPL